MSAIRPYVGVPRNETYEQQIGEPPVMGRMAGKPFAFWHRARGYRVFRFDDEFDARRFAERTGLNFDGQIREEVVGIVADV